ncbi:MAG: DUF2062 domain-containing protein [Desulfobulbus sp.]|jgi:uncharacterized protein (DUF2062 family)|nr:DUF2062 domain-containing protein [Desulfobulbus sp.]
MSLPRALRYRLYRFKRLQGSVHSLALGAAIGAAIGITPTIPLHSVLILAATLACRSNPIAGILAATVVSNPLTLIPQYWLAWRIGDWFLPGRLCWERLHDTLVLFHTRGLMDSLQILGDMGMDALLVMLAGGLVLALPTGLCTYVLVRRFFTRLRNRRRQAHLLNARDS